MLTATYDAKDHEDKIYKMWEDSNVFKANSKSEKEAFTISMPPPNATGVLHLGHAVMLALEDIMIRYKRMKGYEVLWLPGTDHAAIATQNKVEKILASEEGITKEQIGRETFLNRVKEYVANSQGIIRNQIKKMGASCDWSREKYTLDDDLSEAVKEVFVKMHKDKLIYRGYRIVNWCPRCKSTLADDEVEHEEIEGNFYYIFYPFKNTKEGLIIATTRPETMLGDTAVAVNPKDNRFNKYIGETLIVPLINREIKIIGDEYVDIKTGTGALKVTPAHDPNDFEIGKRHNLESIKIMDNEGKINEKGGVYKNLDRFSARKKIVEDLKNQGLLKEIKAHPHNVGHCYRCNTIIEPLTSEQWFIDVNKKIDSLNGKSIKEKANEVVRNAEIEIIPKRFEKQYFNWTENLRDWCISRQIWWGHRIPVWYCMNQESNNPKCKQPIVSKENLTVCPHCNSSKLKQDNDTLDTWFSSGLWTFSTLGWPNESEDFKKFHPTDVLETGYDILTFWVIRMVIMTTYATGQIPFKKVYLHGLIRDKEGRKMSKSLDNGIDPIEMINKFGTDALRMSMIIGNSPGNDMRLYEEKIKAYRNFTNKLWNASRFVLGIFEEKNINEKLEINYEDLSMADEWILGKLNYTIENAIKGLDKFKISEVAQSLYDFLWNDFCDWYLELSKGEKQNLAVLQYVLKNILILLHPFMPFVTEVIWSKFPGENSMLISHNFSKSNERKFDTKSMSEIIDLIIKIRHLRSENKIEAAKKIPVILISQKKLKLIEKAKNDIIRLARISNLEIKTNPEEINNSAHDIIHEISIYIPLDGLVDTEKEKLRLKKEIENLNKYIDNINNKLSNQNFIKNAPEQVVKQNKETLKSTSDKIKKLEEQLLKIK